MLSTKDYIYISAIGILFGAVIYLFSTKPKVAYVRAMDMFEQYEGMKDASKLYQQKHDKWKAEADSLQKHLDLQVEIYEAELSSLSEQELKDKQAYLSALHQNYTERVQQIEQKAAEADQKMTTSVLNRINQFVENYGTENGYALIFTTVTDGQILFGSEELDITDELTESLNKAYKGE